MEPKTVTIGATIGPVKHKAHSFLEPDDMPEKSQVLVGDTMIVHDFHFKAVRREREGTWFRVWVEPILK